MESKQVFKKFEDFAVKQDERNQFGKFDFDDFPTISKQFKEFYKEYNPIDVEIDLGKNGVLQFFSGKELLDIQQEYGLTDYIVFGELEGDPIALKEGKIFLAVHGTGQFEFKMINDDFVCFLEELIEEEISIDT